MVNPISETTASALEEAAMDLVSTSNSNTEPIETETSTTEPTITSESNSSTPQVPNEDPTLSESTIPSAEAVNPMAENAPETTKSESNVSATYGNYDDYQLLPDAPWPPPIFVKQEISPQERYYIEHRWYSQWSFFDSKASQNKNRYHRIQLIVGLGSVTVPVLVGINTDGTLRAVLYVVTIVISLAVAMSTAIESLYAFGDNWRSYRSAAEDLHQEKSLYDVKAGRYANNPQGFLRFVERCEEIIAQQNGRWIQSQENVAEQAKEQGEEFLDSYGAQDGNDSDDDSSQSNSITTVTQSPSLEPVNVESTSIG